MPVSKLLARAVILVALVGFIVPASAQDSVKTVQSKIYIAEGEIDLTQFLPPPPANDSATTQKELAELLRWQSQRTPDQIAFAKADTNISVFRFADVLGPLFDEASLPVTTRFFSDVTMNVETLINYPKAYYHRTRPYILDTRIQPVLPKPNNDSYPSGHSTAGHFYAIILADMVSGKGGGSLCTGDSFALNRVIGGVHYPTDIEAGKLSGTLIAEEMFTSLEFRKDFDRARDELRKALNLPRRDESGAPNAQALWLGHGWVPLAKLAAAAAEAAFE